MKTDWVDRILLKHGWYRPNEAPLYIRQTREGDLYYPEARHLAAMVSDSLKQTEEMYAGRLEEIDEQHLIKYMQEDTAHIYLGKIDMETLLVLSCDALWLHGKELFNKYKEIYKSYTGKEYKL